VVRLLTGVMMSAILRQFGISAAALLGKGSESHVYALDQTRVVRIYPPGASLAYIDARRHFYTLLAARQPPFVIPRVLEHGVLDAHPYTIEQRMHGHDLASVLPQLTGQNRARALTSYLDLATRIGTIQFPDAPFGEMILPGALQRATWPGFLWDRVQQTLHTSYPELAQDVPQLGRILAAFHKQLANMITLSTKCLVHGDYFAGNVFIDDTLTVYGIGDFGYSTLVGDPRMDIAGAIVFLEVVEGYQATDTELLLDHVQRGDSRVSADIIDLYRLYYSLYFSHCKHDDPKTYAWCVQNLHSCRPTR
jgi:aminoglycoside phosphotransferase (APT) family kinase protein